MQELVDATENKTCATTDRPRVKGEFCGTCPVCGYPLVWRRNDQTGELYRGCVNFHGGCQFKERSY